MVNPVALIGRTRRRLARMAALEAALWPALPLALTLALAINLDWIGAATWERLGYLLTASAADRVCALLLAAAALELIAAAPLAWRAYRRAGDFIGTARKIDNYVGAHQEVLTLATLADPEDDEARARRSPLFPMLWRRVVAYLDLFEPRREFPFDWIRPVRRSAWAALGTLALLALAMTVFLKLPTPAELAAHRLRGAAKALAADAPADQALAASMRDLARDLENPELPPARKLAELAAMRRQLADRRQAGSSMAMSAAGGGSGSGSGSGAGQGSGSGSGAGAGQGSGQGGGQGSGKGSGQGSGKGSGKGSGQGGGAAKAGGHKGKGNLQIAELDQALSQAAAKIQSGKGPQPQPGGSTPSETGAGAAPKQGNNPNASGPQHRPDQIANASVPKPAAVGKSGVPMPAGGTPSGRKRDAGSLGDTHLGEFPKAGHFERFYKAGEGPPLIIRDARYVTFRLPSSSSAKGANGRLVAGGARTAAATPYSNAPLKADRMADLPDERQLVPPRYRDLIH